LKTDTTLVLFPAAPAELWQILQGGCDVGSRNDWGHPRTCHGPDDCVGPLQAHLISRKAKGPPWLAASGMLVPEIINGRSLRNHCGSGSAGKLFHRVWHRYGDGATGCRIGRAAPARNAQPSNRANLVTLLRPGSDRQVCKRIRAGCAAEQRDDIATPHHLAPKPVDQNRAPKLSTQITDLRATQSTPVGSAATDCPCCSAGRPRRGRDRDAGRRNTRQSRRGRRCG